MSDTQDPIEEVLEPEAIQPTPPASAISETEQKCADYLAGWQRATADYANLKKDMERLRDEVGESAKARTLRPILEVFDSFKKAASHKPEVVATDENKVLTQWMTGIDGIRSQMESALKNLGVTAIDQSGIPFDANKHEAMLSRADESAASGTVLEVLEPGYIIGDRVVRPARVVVAN